ncbi:MAG: M81 family metallopeptidase [Chloroflexi bacterium]|nr:M81 family metallopeptidase [Chloroflexota bacterium]
MTCKSTFRMAAAGIAIECATFSPLPAELSDFDILRGDALLSRYPFAATHPDIDFAPIMQAHAVPGGVLRRSVYDALKAEILAELRAGGPWDGVYLDMHGAMSVDGLEDAEADFIGAVRDLVGPAPLISASYDLHGNLSAAIMNQLDLITAYRTAPHEDALATRARALDLLIHCLRAGIRPEKAFIPIPLLLSGERAMTIVEPGRSVYAKIEDLTDGEAVLDASLLVGFTWADQARSQASAVALGMDTAATWAAARVLAAAYWEARHQFGFCVPTGNTDECIKMALASTASTVFLSDSGDNVTGGAAGDVPYVLERLLAHRVPKTLYAGLTDTAAVDTCFAAGTGARLSLSLGGKLDPVHGRPLSVYGAVMQLHESKASGRQVIFRVDRVDVILNERRLAFTTLAQFSDLGIDPLSYRIVCLKLGYLFPDFQRIAPEAIMALSPGAINAQPETLPFHKIQRPMFPFDRDFNWSP